MIRIDKLTRRYGPLVAVHDFSAEIQRGEIVGLLGHNGAGKTTVMKMITGFLDPTSGSVQIGGVDVAADRARAQQLIGYLPENAPLYPEMLVQEYLLMMAELRGVPSGQRERAVAEAVVATGLEDKLVSPIRTLSKGFRQRVGIAQAIVHKPAVLVLDEPTNGLDPTQIQSIRKLIRRLGEDTTIILSTHILQEIEAVCDRVMVMIQGRLITDRPLQDLVDSHAVRMTVKGASDVASVVSGIEGVQSVRRGGADDEDPDFTRWTLECVAESNPIPQVIAAGVAAGWTFGAIAPEQRTLERVFNDLEQEYIGMAEAR